MPVGPDQEGGVGVARLAQASGMQSLRAHGIRKALAGITTIDEVLRITLEAA